jgi:hypothetical protein
MREEIRNGTMPEMFIGAVDIHRLNAFVQGSELTLYYNRVPNESYPQFLTWLRDVKQEFPQGGGWAKEGRSWTPLSWPMPQRSHVCVTEVFVGLRSCGQRVLLRWPLRFLGTQHEAEMCRNLPAQFNTL